MRPLNSSHCCTGRTGTSATPTSGGGICSAAWPPLQPASTVRAIAPDAPSASRSEEHTSELQSRENLVCRLLLEKKKLLISSANTKLAKMGPFLMEKSFSFMLYVMVSARSV